MGTTAGFLCLFVALVLLAGLLLPGSERDHAAVVVGCALYLLAYGIGSYMDWIPWSRAPMWQHELAAVAMMPVAGVILWATGGASSYALPLLILPLFFIAYFYRRRMALLFVGLLVLTFGTPLLYDPNAMEVGYPARVLTVAVASFAFMTVVVWLKEKLVVAERRQRAMALRDSLTGLGNRRAFDAALQREVAHFGELDGDRDRVPSALLIVDLDRFKAVNDAFGHPAGDRVLRGVANCCAGVVRPGDTLARIGGDEFAVVAPRAGRAGARRMARALEEAVAAVAANPEADPMSATVSYALTGEDGRNAAELMHEADRRLHEAKRHRRNTGASSMVS